MPIEKSKIGLFQHMYAGWKPVPEGSSIRTTASHVLVGRTRQNPNGPDLVRDWLVAEGVVKLNADSPEDLTLVYKDGATETLHREEIRILIQPVLGFLRKTDLSWREKSNRQR